VVNTLYFSTFKPYYLLEQELVYLIGSCGVAVMWQVKYPSVAVLLHLLAPVSSSAISTAGSESRLRYYDHVTQ